MCLIVGASTVVNSFADNVAKIGDVEYATLGEAMVAAADGQTVILMSDVEVREMVPVTKSITLDVNGKTVTNNVTKSRLFRLSDITFTIDGNDGKIITPVANTESYGFVDFRDVNNIAGANTRLIAKNLSFEGGTNDGSLFAFRTHGQSLEFNNVNATLTESNTWSIINGYGLKVNISVTGGNYICRSTKTEVGVFQAGSGSTIEFTGVNVNTTVGPIFEVVQSNATFTNCTMKNTSTNGFYASCIASSYGGNVTIDGGSYSAEYAVYVYNSGGSLTIKGDGTFAGNTAAVQVDREENASYSAVATLTSGTFNGNVISNGFGSDVRIDGGKITGKTIAHGKNSSVTISDGTLADVVATGENASINVSGGTVKGDVNIGNNSTLAVTGGTFNKEIPEGTFNVVMQKKSGETLNVKLGEGANVSIADGDINGIDVKADVNNVGIAYTRNFSDKWQAMFVPFRMTLDAEILADFDFAEIWDTELVDNAPTIEYIKLSEGDVIEPNVPCLVRAKVAGEQTLSVKNTLLAQTMVPDVNCSTIKQNFNFVGVYGKTTLLDKYGYYLNAEEQAFRPVANETQTLPSCRFYMTVQNKADGSYDYYTQGVAKAVKIRVIGDDMQGTTGMDGIKYDTDNSRVYTIQGTYVGNSVNGLKAGVYIVDKRKVVVK